MNQAHIMKMKNGILRIARLDMNFDTGHARYNGISIRKRGNTIVTEWHLDRALYIKFLEEGTVNMRAYNVVSNARRNIDEYVLNYVLGGEDNLRKAYRRMKEQERQHRKRFYNDSIEEQLQAREDNELRCKIRFMGAHKL